MIGGEQKSEIIEYEEVEEDYYEIDDDAYAKNNGKQRRKTGDIDDAYDEKVFPAYILEFIYVSSDLRNRCSQFKTYKKS